ncbi:MAG: aminotransferase class IV [Acidimicrobiales bacterium]
MEPAAKALITVVDRGFQMGDGVFETLRVVGGQVLDLPLHLSRLEAPAVVLAIPPPHDLERRVGDAVAELCKANLLDGAGAKAAVRVTASRGADDALFLTTGGLVAEPTSSSVFLVEPDGLVTPSLDCGIIVSMTRGWTISTGVPRLGLLVRQGRITVDDLFRADEIFLASSVAGMLPVTSVDGRALGDGKPGV